MKERFSMRGFIHNEIYETGMIARSTFQKKVRKVYNMPELMKFYYQRLKKTKKNYPII